jgi:hypothetical protein
VDDEAPTPIPGSPDEADEPPGRVDTVLQEPLGAGPTEVAPRLLKHDPQEIRRLIAMAFSAGELSKFAERWRVFIDREGSVDDGARALVRAVDGRGKLAPLVESLRAHKPLFEWPEPTVEVEPAPPVRSAAAPDAEPPDPAKAQAMTEPRADPAPSSVRAPIVDPFQAGGSDGEASPEAVIIPKRWLMAGGALTAAVALGGIVVWAVVGGDASSNESASLALDASAELARSVSAVRSACKVDEEGDSARDQLTSAFRRCSVPTIRPSRVDVPLPPRPKPVPDPGPIALPQRPPGPVSRRPACLDQCHQIHNQCKKSQCGAEPASAAEYETYQRCLASCLSQYSRCRLTCR